jgi:glycosyltransferase involved in cell wall biosynthesis
LSFDASKAANRVEWTFRNPHLGDWYRSHLQQSKPDLVHINGGYLVGGSAFEAAFDLMIPVVLTLHDYWFLCPLTTLLRRTGEICGEPVPPERCTWCLLTEKRRYRLPDIRTSGLMGDLYLLANRVPLYRKLSPTTKITSQIVERRAYLNSILKRVDAVLSPSRFLIEKMQEYGFEAQKMCYAPFSVNLERLEASTQTGKQNYLRIGYLGQIAPHKGVHLLIKAFLSLKQAEDARLLIYGRKREGNPYYELLKRLAGDDPRIAFMGEYDNRAVAQVLAGVDVIVTPSVWYENRPTVIIEAQVAGVPVIVPRLGGMAELVKHGVDGLVYQPGDEADLKAQLQRLVDEPGLLRTLADGAPNILTSEQEMDRLVEIYRTVIQQATVRAKSLDTVS